MVSEAQERVVAKAEAIIVSFDYENGNKCHLPDSWIHAMGIKK